MARGTCSHGKYPGNSYGDITVSGSTERKVEKHEAKCRNAHVFWHFTFMGMFKCLCCSSCGKQVA